MNPGWIIYGDVARYWCPWLGYYEPLMWGWLERDI